MSEFHPAYFAVRFRTESTITDWPQAFAIITAYATTGESWSDERNAEADHRLYTELRGLGCAPVRITGYDPQTGHAEPGWAVELTLDKALAIGRTYAQDAIFWVQDDALSVAKCNSPFTQQMIGRFLERVTPSDAPTAT